MFYVVVLGPEGRHAAALKSFEDRLSAERECHEYRLVHTAEDRLDHYVVEAGSKEEAVRKARNLYRD